jgi:hypothetical protein
MAILQANISQTRFSKSLLLLQAGEAKQQFSDANAPEKVAGKLPVTGKPGTLGVEEQVHSVQPNSCWFLMPPGKLATQSIPDKKVPLLCYR